MRENQETRLRKHYKTVIPIMTTICPNRKKANIIQRQVYRYGK